MTNTSSSSSSTDTTGSDIASVPARKAALHEVTHQLRNELYVILLHARRARYELDDGQGNDAKERLTQIESGTQEVQALLDDLIAIAER